MQGANRGGPGRGQGRKPVKQGEETVTLSLRVTVAQREKLARLGGAEWVRCKIDRAKEHNDLGNRRDAVPIGGASVLTDELCHLRTK